MHARWHEVVLKHLDALRRIEQQSSILVMETDGAAPERFLLGFRGRGLHVSSAAPGLELAEWHQAAIRLPSGYPQHPPDIQWHTPIAHPNVSYSGFVQLEDLGLPWDQTLDLTIVSERLWDVVRLAYVNLNRVVNQSVHRLLTEQAYWRLPLDARPLCDRQTVALANLVQYRRRGAAPVTSASPASGDSSLLILDENTVPPETAPSPAPSPAHHDKNVLYIGDDS